MINSNGVISLETSGEQNTINQLTPVRQAREASPWLCLWPDVCKIQRTAISNWFSEVVTAGPQGLATGGQGNIGGKRYIYIIKNIFFMNITCSIQQTLPLPRQTSFKELTFSAILSYMHICTFIFTRLMTNNVYYTFSLHTFYFLICQYHTKAFTQCEIQRK